MSYEREVDEEVARCVAAIVFYHNSPQSDQNRGVLREDLREVAEWAFDAKLGRNEAVQVLFGPIRADLALRFGDQVGDSLFTDFLVAYERAARSVRRAAARNEQPVKSAPLPTVV
jgi:hypothetical protein